MVSLKAVSNLESWSFAGSIRSLFCCFPKPERFHGKQAHQNGGLSKAPSDIEMDNVEKRGDVDGADNGLHEAGNGQNCDTGPDKEFMSATGTPRNQIETVGNRNIEKTGNIENGQTEESRQSGFGEPTIVTKGGEDKSDAINQQDDVTAAADAAAAAALTVPTSTAPTSAASDAALDSAAPDTFHVNEDDPCQTAMVGNCSSALLAEDEQINHDRVFFDVSDLEERQRNMTSASGRLHVTFDFDFDKDRLNVVVHEALEIPTQDRGGSTSTQVHLAVVPAKSARQKTKVKTGENPKFDETFTFKIRKDELQRLGMRLRLYGCDQWKSKHLIGESVLPLSTLVLDKSCCSHWLTLEPRCNMSNMFADTDNESGRSRSQSGSVASSSDQSVDDGPAALLIGLGYKGTTGRLIVEVIQGSNFNSLTLNRAPDTFVKVTLNSAEGQEISRSKTRIKKMQSSPTFREKFVFQVVESQLAQVSVMLSVYSKRTMKREEQIGWCMFGSSSSGPEETLHWTDMRTGSGQQLDRWHFLIEP